MKKIIGLLGIFALVLNGCSGEDGRDGLDGLDGNNGLNGENAAMPLVFETTQNLTYNTDNGLWVSELVYFSDENITPLTQDVVLVYRLERVTDNGDNIWSQLPQNFFLETGTIQYIFNFSVNGADADKSAEFIIDGNYDISALDSAFTLNQTFRVVVVPSQVAETFDTNSINLQTVMKNLNLSEKDIKIIK